VLVHDLCEGCSKAFQPIGRTVAIVMVVLRAARDHLMNVPEGSESGRKQSSRNVSAYTSPIRWGFMSYLEALGLTGYVTGERPLADYAKLEVDGQSEAFSTPWISFK
jgi:hypothetical protein